MTNRLVSLAYWINFPTLILCGGCMICYNSHSSFSNMIQEKWAYMGLLILLIRCMISVFHRKKLVSCPNQIMNSYVLICIIEVLIALLQILHLFKSPNPFYSFTGSFQNPAEFAMVITICIPICIFNAFNSLGKIKKIWFLIATVMFLFVIFSESRTCILSIIVSFIIIIIYEKVNPLWPISYRWIFTLVLFLIISLFVLYYYKRDSADGRLFILLICFKMIASKPLFGWGCHGFDSSYMQYQADFLRENQESRFYLLAENISHPCNEFILFGVKFGIVGLIIIFAMILYIFRMTIMINNLNKRLYLCLLNILIIFSLFSYPFTNVIIWIISTYVICSIICDYSRYHPQIRSLALGGIFLYISLIFFKNRKFHHEWIWLKTHISSASTMVKNDKYKTIYQSLNDNTSFLYNYGVWLYCNDFYKESIEILLKCRTHYDDYYIELLLADNYRQLGNFEQAIESFKTASAMIPNRFLPLYYKMLIYRDIGDNLNAYRIAKLILNKPVKVHGSMAIKNIKHEAEQLLHSMSLETIM